MTSNIFDIWTVILEAKLYGVSIEITLIQWKKSPLSFCVRTLRIVENVFGIRTHVCKKYFTFEQPHTVEQNTLIVIKGTDRVEKAYGCVEIMSCCVYVSKCLTNGGINFGELSGKCENCNWE